MSDKPLFDLQAHSTCSDGALEPAAVVQAAARAGVRLLSLTDHDTVDGVAEAIAEGGRLGLQVASGVEVSSVDGRQQDLHILGYGIDPGDATLLERLATYRADRDVRADAMAAQLRELGYQLDESDLDARRAAGQPIGRPHLSQAVVSHPANAERLAREGLTDLTGFLVAYLIEGRAAFVGRSKPSIREAIQAIHDAGGVAVWAHPFWDLESDEEVLACSERYAAAGLDGVEAFYPTHSEHQARLLANRCEELGLLTTGSADFHGPEHRLFNAFRAFETYGCEPRLGPIGSPGTLLSKKPGELARRACSATCWQHLVRRTLGTVGVDPVVARLRNTVVNLRRRRR